MNILVGLGKNKTLTYGTATKYNKNCIGIISKNKYLQLVSDGKPEIIIKNGVLEPLIPFTSSDIKLNTLERFIILISGTSGDGKSLLASIFVKQFKTLHQHREVFRVSMKDINIDRNFKDLNFIIPVDIDTELDLIQTISDVPADSLWIIDDCDNQKEVYRVLNLLGEHGRERGINIIFITHYNSRVNDSSIYKECNIYITFHNNISNNRMLELHYKIDKKNLEWLKSLNQTSYIFNKTNQCIICNNFCCKLNKLNYSIEEKEEIMNLLI